MSATFYTDPKYVTLLSTMALDGKPMGEVFERLILNDLYIADNFTNVVGIWQCGWYYDSTEQGYSKGSMCWLNTEEPITFLRKNHDIIQEYTDLKSLIINKLPDFDPNSEEVVSAYYNAMTGYTDPSIGIIEPLEPIFEIGGYSKGAQLVVSLKDNNKNLVTDTTAWKPFFVDELSGKEKIWSIVDDLMKSVLSTHMLEYHLSGHEEEILSSLSEYEDEFEEEHKITELPFRFYTSLNRRNKKLTGVDYVLDYVRKPYVSTTSISGSISEYQAVRRWHSGLVEHFGTVSKENLLFRLSNYLVIPFDWKFLDVGGTKAYGYGSVSEHLKGILSVLETNDHQVSPLDNFVNATFEMEDYSVDNHRAAMPFADSDYSIAVTPIFQTPVGIEENYIEAQFGTGASNQKWNSNYLMDAVDSRLKTRKFCAIDLASDRTVAPYFSYYAVGRGSY